MDSIIFKLKLDKEAALRAARLRRDLGPFYDGAGIPPYSQDPKLSDSPNSGSLAGLIQEPRGSHPIIKKGLLKLLLFTTNNLDIKSLNIHLQEKGYNSFVTQMSKRKELPFFCKTFSKRSPYLVDSALLWFQQIPFAEFGCLHLQLIHSVTPLQIHVRSVVSESRQLSNVSYGVLDI